MTWLCLYLLLGLVICNGADMGHMRLYGYPMHPYLWLAGVFLYPIMLVIGRRKR